MGKADPNETVAPAGHGAAPASTSTAGATSVTSAQAQVTSVNPTRVVSSGM